MKKIILLLAMVPLCLLAATPKRVVVTVKASQMKRTPSDITNNLNNPPDWEMDYVVPAQEAARLKGLKIHVQILDNRGHLSNKFVTYFSNAYRPLQISVHPKQVKRPWTAHELGDVGTFVIVGE